MDMDLTRDAAHRLDAAIDQSYSADVILGEGALREYLTTTGSVYRHRMRDEFYVKGCKDEREAFDKVMDKSGRKSSTYTLE